MICHIVMFRARDRAEVEAVRRGLELLCANPHARTLEVAPNLRLDDWSDEVDVVVYGEFDDEAALEAFKAHPSYAESIAVVPPLRDLRIAADIEANGERSS